MHRSGTSWLAGSLQEKGLELGEVSTREQHNVKGNRESAVLMAIHDGVLADNDGSWKKPAWPNRWSAERKAELAGQAELIVGKQRNGPTGTVGLTFLAQYMRFENAARERF